jgi:hypothetical protein
VIGTLFSILGMLVAALGMLMAAVVCVAFAAAGPLLTLNDRFPARHIRRYCPATLPAPNPNEPPDALALIPARDPDLPNAAHSGDNDTTVAA